MPFLKPEDIIAQANIQEGMKVADFGSGAGFRTMALAHAVGNSGHVYAFDVRKETLEVVRGKAKSEHLLNIDIIWTDLESPNATMLKNEMLDHVVITNMLFQAENKQAVVAEAFRILKPRGTVSVVEWDISAGAIGPPQDHLIDKLKAKEIFTSAGFQWDKEFYAGEHHYGFLFRKP